MPKDNNNEDFNEYEIPTTSMDEVGKENPISATGIKEIIETTASINPTSFWMVFMIVLSVGLAGVLFFGGGYLIDENKTLKGEKKEIQIKLDDCPDKALERFKQQQREIQDIKKSVLSDSVQLDILEAAKKRRIEKLEQIDKMK